MLCSADGIIKVEGVFLAGHVLFPFIFVRVKKILHSLLLFFLLGTVAGKAQNWRWARSAINSANASSVPAGIAADPWGNIYTAGFYSGSNIRFDSFTLANANAGNPDNNFFLTKFTPAGQVSWAKGAGPLEQASITAIATDSAGNVYVTGSFSSPVLTLGAVALQNATPAASGDNLFLAKYDTSGHVLWARAAVSPFPSYGTALRQGPGGNILITGTFNDSITLGSVHLHSPQPVSFFYGSFDKNGNPAWLRAGCGKGRCNVVCNGIDYDRSGALYLSGFFNSDSLFIGNTVLANPFVHAFGTGQVYLLKCDVLGNAAWLKLAAGGNGANYTLAPAADASGHVYLAGVYNDTLTIGTATLYDTLNGGDNNVFISQWDTSGALIWARSFGGDLGVAADKLFLGIDEEPVLAGHFNSTSVVIGNTTLVNDSAGNFDIYLAKYQADGTPRWAVSTGGPQDDILYNACTDKTGNIYVTGYFESDSIRFGSTVLTSAASQGTANFFLSKLSDVLGILGFNAPLSGASVYPNPMTGSATIRLNNPDNRAFDFILYDTFGKEVKHTVLPNENEFGVQRESLAAGMYFYVLQNKDQHCVGRGKLIIQ